MSENPFKWLLVFIAGSSLLAALAYARHAGRELPSLVLRLVWVAVAIGALTTSRPSGLVVSAVMVMAGLLVTELQSLLRTLVVRARLEGRFSRARALSLGQVLVAPTALHRTTYRACAVLDDVQRGRGSLDALERLLGQRVTPEEDRLIAGTALEGRVLLRDWDAIFTSFAVLHGKGELMPAPGAVACVTALGSLGRLEDAAAAIEYLDRHPAIPTGPPPDLDDLAELERYRTKARVIFLAYAGHGALVQRLRRESRAIRRLFSPEEGARLDEAARDRPARDDPAIESFADRIAAEVIAESELPGTPASTAGTPWATVALSVLCVLVYAGVALTSAGPFWSALLAPSSDALVAWGAFRADLLRGGDAYRLFACTLLHAHILHLLMNVRALTWIGPVAEHVLGRSRFLLVYLAAGLAGSFACLYAHPHQIMVGASGAVCGVAGAGVVILRRLGPSSPALWHQRQTKLFRGLLIGTVGLGALLPFVSNTAHVGGFAAGAAGAWLLGGTSPSRGSRRGGLLLAIVVGAAWLWLSARTASRTVEQLGPPAAVRRVEQLAWECGEGDASSCFEAGLACDGDGGVPANPTRAASMYEAACDGGVLVGCYDLGVDYQLGLGVAVDVPRAVGLYQRACDGGSEWGCTALGNLYFDGKGVPKDEALAVSFYERSCGADRTRGCFRLAYALVNGRGVARDERRAASLYAERCEGGDALACNNLGDLYEHGRGVAGDDAAAARLYLQSCNGGSAWGCEDYGNLLRLGRGVPADPVRGVDYLRRGCAGGCDEGCARLRELGLSPEASPLAP